MSGPEGTPAEERSGTAISSATEPPPADERSRVEAAAEATGDPATRHRTRFNIGELRNLALFGVLVLLFVVGSLTKPAEFFAYDNVVVILTQASVIGVITVGMTF